MTLGYNYDTGKYAIIGKRVQDVYGETGTVESIMAGMAGMVYVDWDNGDDHGISASLLVEVAA